MLRTMRWIVGDVQGCAAELQDLLDTVRFDPAADELWLAGDLINRGPASLETLRLWRDVGGHGVLGNHDLYALAAWKGLRDRGNDTLDALFAAEDRDRLLSRLAACPSLVFLGSSGDGPDVWVVHAGLHPEWLDLPAVAQRLNQRPDDDRWLRCPDVGFAAHVRCCTATGELGPGSAAICAPGYAPWFDFYGGDTLVVHGHWATRGYYRGRASLGLDSGCVYGRPLTAWCQEEDRIVEIPSHQLKRFA